LVGIFIFTRIEHWYRRFFVVGIVQRVIGESKEDVEEEVPNTHNTHRVTKADLLAKAESLDFDAALNKYTTGAHPTINAGAQSAGDNAKPGKLSRPPRQSRPLHRDYPPIEDTDDD
jgi:hypothetical protein